MKKRRSQHALADAAVDRLLVNVRRIYAPGAPLHAPISPEDLIEYAESYARAGWYAGYQAAERRARAASKKYGV